MIMNLYRPRGWGEFAVALDAAMEGNATYIFEYTRVLVELDTTVVDDDRYAGVRESRSAVMFGYDG